MGFRIVTERVGRDINYGFRFANASPSQGFISGRTKSFDGRQVQYGMVVLSGKEGPLHLQDMDLRYVTANGIQCGRERAARVHMSAIFGNPDDCNNFRTVLFGVYPFGKWHGNHLFEAALAQTEKKQHSDGDVYSTSLSFPLPVGFERHEHPFYIHLELSTGSGSFYSADLALPSPELVKLALRLNRSLGATVLPPTGFRQAKLSL